MNDSQKSLFDLLNEDAIAKTDKPQSFNLLDKLYRDEFEIRKQKDVTLEIDFRSAL